MKVVVENLSDIKKKVTIEVPNERYTDMIEEAYASLKAEAEMDGFRKGKVPDNVLKQKYGEKVNEDVSKRLVEFTYIEAVRSEGLKPISNPEVESVRVPDETNDSFCYTLMVDVLPNIEITGYRDIVSEAVEVEVKDEDIDEQLKFLCEKNSELVESDEPIADASAVTIDFAVTIDGKPVDKSDVKDYLFVVGEEKTNFPEFEDAVKGCKVGDTPEFTKPFPEAYHDKQFAGKDAVFKLTITAVKNKVLKAIDDDFAKDLGCGNLKELKAKISEELVKAKERIEKDKDKRKLMDKLIEENEFEVPESIIAKYYSQIMNNIQDGVRRGVVDPKEMAMNSAESKERCRDMAIKQAKGDILLDCIADKEKIEPTKEDIAQTISDIAAMRQEAPEAIQAKLEEEGVLPVFIDGIRREKVFNSLMESAAAGS